MAFHIELRVNLVKTTNPRVLNIVVMEHVIAIPDLTSCFALMTDSAVVDAALRKSGLI
jgi:hypothetical protein